MPRTQKNDSSGLSDLRVFLSHHAKSSTTDNLLPHPHAMEIINTRIKQYKFRLSECISLTTLKIHDQKQEKNACYDYLSKWITFPGVSNTVSKHIITSFDGLCRLLVDTALFTKTEISCDSWYDLVIYLWQQTSNIISLDHFILWWKSAKNENGATRGDLLLARYKDQVKNLSKIWLEMLFKPEFAVTCNACHATGIWERQYFWNSIGNKFYFLDLMLHGRRGNDKSKTKLSIFGMHKIEKDKVDSFRSIDPKNTPLLKLTIDYCDCLKKIFDCLEAWYFNIFQERNKINMSMFGLSKAFDADSRQSVSSVQSILQAINNMKEELCGIFNAQDLVENMYHKTFTVEYRKLQTFFLEHETRVLLGAFKYHDGRYLRQLYPPGGKLPSEVLGDLKSFFKIGFRYPYVTKFFRMVYILFFSPEQYRLEELMKHRETYFSKLVKTDDDVLGVVVPPIGEFSYYAMATLQAIETDELCFEILLSLLEAFDSVFVFPNYINLTPLGTEMQEESNQPSNLNEVIQLDDDVIVSKDDISTLSALTSPTGSMSASSSSSRQIGGRHSGNHIYFILFYVCIMRACLYVLHSGKNANASSSSSWSQQIGGRHIGMVIIFI
jgi:hypothetical protein